MTEYVDLTDSDDDYDPKRSTRRKKRQRRKRVEITISDESDTSHDSVIELDESDDETPDESKSTNRTPPKRRRGRPPKSKPGESTATGESPAKKTKVETVDNPTKPEIPCPQCDKTFPSQNSLKTHLQHHNLQSSIKRAQPEYKYKCDKCATTFINSILLKKHMCSKLFNCTVCKKRFPDLSSLNGHKRTHAKEQMVKSTTVQVSPKKMKQALPTKTFEAQKTSTMNCKTCGKLCSSLQNLTVHMKTHREFVCGTCLKIFLSQLMLEKHVRESCVKSPQTSRRAMRVKGDAGKRLQLTPPKARTTSVISPGKRVVDKRGMLNLKLKCEQCSMCFSSHRELFKHKVLKHGLETPDKSVLKKEETQRVYKGGVPAGEKLLKSFAGLRSLFTVND